VMFKSVQVSRVHAEIGRQIARRIIAGDLEAGQYLPTETELTRDFGVSRVAVREALRSLAQRGLLEQSQGRRTVILPIEKWDVFDPMVLSIMREEGKIFPVLKDFTWIRLNLEPAVAAEAAKNSSPELVASLEAIVAEMERLQEEHEGYYIADLDFHARLATAMGNRVLHRLMKVMGTLFSPERRLPEDAPYASPSKGVKDHKAIIKAIADRDAERAHELMRKHIAWAAKGIEQMYGSGAKLPPLPKDEA
jgi:DNA-binding FadR family transcriptional regulator